MGRINFKHKASNVSVRTAIWLVSNSLHYLHSVTVRSCRYYLLSLFTLLKYFCFPSTRCKIVLVPVKFIFHFFHRISGMLWKNKYLKWTHLIYHMSVIPRNEKIACKKSLYISEVRGCIFHRFSNWLQVFSIEDFGENLSIYFWKQDD